MDLSTEAHAINEEAAEPSTTLTEDGAPSKRRGRPPGSRTRSTSDKKKVKAAQVKTAAQMVNRMFFGTVRTVLGPEANPTIEETKELDGNLIAYLETKPDFDLPPGLVLLGAYGMYLGAKLEQETARNRTKKIVGGVGSAIKGFFGKLKRKGKKDASVTS